MLAAIGDLDLTLTTNGSLLPQKAQALRDAGLRPRDRQPRLARRRGLHGDERRRLPGANACSTGSTPPPTPGCPVKVNMVVKRGVNEDSDRSPMARLLPRARPHPPLHRVHGRRRTRTAGGSTTSSRPPRSSRAIDAELPLEPVEPNYRGEVARRWRYRDGSGEIGVIASVTQPFCGDCTRARLSAEGRLYTCLFARPRPRPARARSAAARPTTSCARRSARIWGRRTDRYSEIRSAEHGRAAQGRDVATSAGRGE